MRWRCPTATRSRRGSTSSPRRTASTSSSRRATGTRPRTRRSPRRAGRGPRTAWPDTEGAQLHAGLDAAHVDVIVDKGTDPGTEGYSGFDGTDLAALLRDRGIDRITVAGLATDYCVRATALDALRAGFAVTVDDRASRGIDPDGSAAALDEVRAAGGEVMGSSET